MSEFKRMKIPCSEAECGPKCGFCGGTSFIEECGACLGEYASLPDGCNSCNSHGTASDKAAANSLLDIEPGQFLIPVKFSNPTRTKARAYTAPKRSTMRIEIVQNGRVLSQHNYNGRSYIEAPPEGDYTIRLTNTQSRARSFSARQSRQLAVVSVDGLNIVTGEKAGFDGPGYVLAAGQTIEIPGWRRTDSEVAAFQFKPQESSYAAAMGNGTSNTGVIGVAVFDEKAAPVRDILRSRTVTKTVTETTIHDRLNARAHTKGIRSDGRARPNEKIDGTLYSERSESWPAAAAAAASAASEESATTYSASSLNTLTREEGQALRPEMYEDYGIPCSTLGRRSRAKTPELGTGYGGRQTMHTAETTFKRATQVPGLVITLQYAVRAKLQEWGVPLPSTPPLPTAFPASQAAVPAPPGWGG